ncbi:MAG: hypothetical protein PHP51_04765 [Desulfotomaculaceae bacterium]|nr:hypothetical protein [Desulfotomaculaceae bacterium]MDD4766177.1 hypothetical protein [Desulfotomaculaceae bacterium]
MYFSVELIISVVTALLALALLLFIIDWRYFRDWVVIFLFKCILDSLWGTAVVNKEMLEYPFRQLPQFFKMSLLFEYWVFPILCLLYNQVTRKRGVWPIIYYAVLFSAVVTAIEYPLELYTDLIEYHTWSWFTTFYTLTITFLASRAFIAFYRWGCDHFSPKEFRHKK